MSTEERLEVLEKVVSILMDRIGILNTRVDEINNRVIELEANNPHETTQQFSMSGDSSLSLFEKMFPGMAASKKANADAAALSGVTSMVGVGGTEYDADASPQAKPQVQPQATEPPNRGAAPRRTKIISRQ